LHPANFQFKEILNVKNDLLGTVLATFMAYEMLQLRKNIESICPQTKSLGAGYSKK
jgi:hypothetical protein